MKKKFIGLFILISAITMGENIRLDLEEAIDLAYKNNYLIKNSELDLESSNLKMKQAVKNLLPTLEYTGNYTGYDKERSYNGILTDESFENKIYINQNIFSGGENFSKISIAKNQKDISQYEYENLRKEIRLSTIEKYIKIIELEKQMEVYKKSLENLEGQQKKIQRKFELNLVAKNMVLPLDTKVLSTKTNILELKNLIEISKIDLKNHLGIKNSDDIEVINNLNEKIQKRKLDLEKDLLFARENNRDNKIAKLQNEIKVEEKNIARAEFLPKVDFTLGYSSGAPKFRDSGDDWEWQTGVKVSMNVFEFGKSLDNYRVSKNEIEKSENLVEKTKDDIDLEIRRSYSNMMTYKNMIKTNKSAVESARENYNVESKRYELDLIDTISLIEIEENLVEAELQLISSELNYYLSYEKYKSLVY